MEECSIFDQQTKSLNALKITSGKLNEVSKTLKGCEEVTRKLSLAIDIIVKNYAIDEERSCLLMDIEKEIKQTS